MSEQHDADLKMIETYESITEFYEAHEHNELTNFYNWPLEVYDRYEEIQTKLEELKDENKDLKQYIEDHQVSDSKGHLSDYYNGIF